MKILFIINEWVGGGIGTYYQNLIPVLQKHGMDITIGVANTVVAESNHLPPEYSIQYTNQKKKQHYSQAFEHLKFNPLLHEHLSTAYALYDQFEGGKGFDLIEVTDYPLLFAPWILEGSNAPVLVQLHGSLGQIEFYENRTGQFERTAAILHFEETILRYADILASPSTKNGNYWQDRLNRQIETLVPIYQSRVDVKSNHLKGTTSPSSGIAIGRVQVWKGPQVLCEAAQFLGKLCPNIQWVGNDNYFKRYELSMSRYLADKYSVWGNQIRYLGSLPYNETLERIQNSSFVVAPSIWDTFNFTILEGMALGKVILCTDGAGVSEHIQHGRNGFVVSAGDPIELSEYIKFIEKMPLNEKEKLGENALDTYLTHFSSSDHLKMRVEWYLSKCSQPKRFKKTAELDWVNNWIKNKENSLNAEALLKQISLRDIVSYLKNKLKHRLFK